MCTIKGNLRLKRKSFDLLKLHYRLKQNRKQLLEDFRQYYLLQLQKKAVSALISHKNQVKAGKRK